MPRGVKAKPGDERTAPNGYSYRYIKDRGWVLIHRLMVEESIGRELEAGERVRFIDGDRFNVHIDNLELFKTSETTARRRLARIEARIEELESERAEILRELQPRESR